MSYLTSRELYIVGHSAAIVAKKVYNTLPRHKRNKSIGNFVRETIKNDKTVKEGLRRAISTMGKAAIEQGVEDALRGQYEPSKFTPS